MKRGPAAQFLLILVLGLGAAISAQEGNKDQPQDLDAPRALPQSGIRAAHDPALAFNEGVYYRFSTGPGIQISVSKDLRHWDSQARSQVFEQRPLWAQTDIPESTDFWAPAIVKCKTGWRLYYAVSSFGKNRSAIGLATNASLDPSSPDYRWRDEGPVIESDASDDYNCIDPCPVFDRDGEAWLSFGSFWTGIKIVRLDKDSGKLAASQGKPLALARRADTVDAIEASFIFPKDGKYYLFVSFDFCCRRTQSNYNIRVGRSDSITGPYLDREGHPMLEGGGTLIRACGDRYKGPGHASVFVDGGTDYLVYHAYDAQAAGQVRFRIEPLSWSADGWPFVPGQGSGMQETGIAPLPQPRQ